MSIKKNEKKESLSLFRSIDSRISSSSTYISNSIAIINGICGWPNTKRSCICYQLWFIRLMIDACPFRFEILPIFMEKDYQENMKISDTNHSRKFQTTLEREKKTKKNYRENVGISIGRQRACLFASRGNAAFER